MFIFLDSLQKYKEIQIYIHISPFFLQKITYNTIALYIVPPSPPNPPASYIMEIPPYWYTGLYFFVCVCSIVFSTHPFYRTLELFPILYSSSNTTLNNLIHFANLNLCRFTCRTYTQKGDCQVKGHVLPKSFSSHHWCMWVSPQLCQQKGWSKLSFCQSDRWDIVSVEFSVDFFLLWAI